MKTQKFLTTLFLTFLMQGVAQHGMAQERMDLSGTWSFQLDDKKAGERERWFEKRSAQLREHMVGWLRSKNVFPVNIPPWEEGGEPGTHQNPRETAGTAPAAPYPNAHSPACLPAQPITCSPTRPSHHPRSRPPARPRALVPVRLCW